MKITSRTRGFWYIDIRIVYSFLDVYMLYYIIYLYIDMPIDGA